MAKTNYRSVDEYIALRPEAMQPILERVRSIIRKALPGVEEAISYQIPAFKVNGKVVLYLAGWKEHYSLYPAIGGLQTQFKDELARYDVSKGTIRFPLTQPVPATLIKRIAKFRAKEVAGKVKAKAVG
jgi:uncharacterized protein YdhG (YjbR/CyaY superfamily)